MAIRSPERNSSGSRLGGSSARAGRGTGAAALTGLANLGGLAAAERAATDAERASDGRGMRKKEGLMTDDGGMDGRKEGAFLFVFVTHVCFVFLHRERADEEARSPQVGSNRRNQNPTAVMMRVVLYTSPHTTAFAW